MIGELTKWQYIALLILLPPIGAFLICTADHIRLRYKVSAVVFCVVVFFAVLTMRMPAGSVTIHAAPMR